MTKHVIFLSAVLLAFVSVLSYAQAPVPFINQPLVPDATAPGGPQFTLTVNGTGFVSDSVVNWNGIPLATQFVSGSRLTATVPATDIATASIGWVTVVNPAPGGGTSNVAFFPVSASTGNLAGFSLTSSPGAGNDAHSVAVGDFNGDGKLDLAVPNWYDNTVSILLGDGNGNFTLASSPSAGSAPDCVAVGDFNGDGKLDLAVGAFGGTVFILLGDGTGTFTLASSPHLPSSVSSVAVGDFNGDGKLDLVTTNYDGWSVSILLGDGTGNFTLASTLGVGAYPISVAAGDFNGDGTLDLAVGCHLGYSLSILLGDGTGNFTPAPSPYVNGDPISVAIGDFNGDGKLDIATANYWSNDLSILLGDGTGNFTLVSSPSLSGGPYSVALGDFNGDGKPDLAVSNLDSNSVSIVLGDGTGNFALASSTGVGNQPITTAVGDFNGDGKLDLATANGPDNTISILLGVPPAPGPNIRLSPGSLTFGTQLFRTSSDPQQVTVTNVGSEPLDITRVVTSPNFSQTNNCPHELAPGEQCSANVVFTPHNVNTITGTITITDNAPNSPQVMPLTGVGTAVTLLPSNLDFGDQQVGTTSQPQAVTLTNYAPKAVTISGADLTGNNPGSFVVQGNSCGRSLPAGQTCTANIAFRPRATGPKNATFSVDDNGGASPQTVALSGTGTK